MPIAPLTPVQRNPNAVAATSDSSGVKTSAPAGAPAVTGAPDSVPSFVAAPPPAAMAEQAAAEKKPYMIFMPKDGAHIASQPYMTSLLARANAAQKACSNSQRGRYVTNLSEAEADYLRQSGLRVVEDKPMSVQPVRAAAGSAAAGEVGPHMQISRAVHGADELQKDGLFTGDGAVVAVIDTGLAPHQDLAPPTKFDDMFTPQPEDPPSDGYGHGTHVNGIAAGVGDPAVGGVRGIAPGAEIWGAKVLDDSGSGSWSSVMSGIERVIEWAKNEERPVVINMSLGGTAQGDPDDDPLNQLLNEAVTEHGILVVVSAGNAGPSEGTIGRPGDAREVISVGAMDHAKTLESSDDTIASFSSRGEPEGGRAGQVGRPHLTAGGVKVRSTVPGGGTEEWSGTSMSAPEVTGAGAALLGRAWQLYKQGKFKIHPKELVKSGELRAILMETALDNPATPDWIEGKGDLRIVPAAELMLSRYGTVHIDDAVARFQEIVESHTIDDGVLTAEEVDQTMAALQRGARDMADPDDRLAYLVGVKEFWSSASVGFPADAAASISQQIVELGIDAHLDRAAESFASVPAALDGWTAFNNWMAESGGSPTGQVLERWLTAVCRGTGAQERIELAGGIRALLAEQPDLAGATEIPRQVAYQAFDERANQPFGSAGEAAAMFRDLSSWLSGDDSVAAIDRQVRLFDAAVASTHSLPLADRVDYLENLQAHLEANGVSMGVWPQMQAGLADETQRALSDQAEAGYASAAAAVDAFDQYVSSQLSGGSELGDSARARLVGMLHTVIEAGSTDLVKSSKQRQGLWQGLQSVIDTKVKPATDNAFGNRIYRMALDTINRTAEASRIVG